jgi:hypothetical protein
MNNASARLLIYTRRDCSLCERMEVAAREVVGPEMPIAMIQIDDDPVLLARYARDIPVLCVDGEPVCKHFLDPQRLREVLEAR